MIFQSSSKKESFIFLTFIKKKDNGTWEKISNGEGKTVKCGLEEIIMMLEVLKKKRKNWSTVHKFKEEKTPISINWEGDSKVWFNVGNYPKMLSYSQIEVLKLLFNHVLEEKVIYSTVPDSNRFSRKKNSRDNNRMGKEKNNGEDGLRVQEELNLGKNIKKIEGKIIGETDKALRVMIDTGEDFWIPKSTIKSQFRYEKNSKQTFLVDTWFLEKNNLL